jgi:hypothetical protein
VILAGVGDAPRNGPGGISPDGEGPGFAEALLVDPARTSDAPWLGPAPAQPGSPLAPRAGRASVCRWVAYGPGELWLDERGRLRTPADEVFERYELIRARDALISRLRRILKAKRHAQRSRGPRRRARPGAAATVGETRAEVQNLVSSFERVPQCAGPGSFLADVDAWRRSPERTLAEEEVGSGWLEFLEQEGPNDWAIRAAPARWKFICMRVTLGHRAVGEPFLARDVARTVLARWPIAPSRDGYERAALAVLDFLESLAEEGVLEQLEGTPIRFSRTE